MPEYRKILILFLAMAISSCRPTGEEPTKVEKKGTKKDIEVLADNFASAVSRLDAEGVTILFGRSADSSYVSDGVFVPRRKIKETFQSFFDDFQEMCFSFEKKRIRVLGPDTAALTGWAHQTGVTKDNLKTDERAIFSLQCFRERGKLRIFQAHKSRMLSYQSSETSKARPRLSKFCQGNGIDLGYGGDPIVPSAIALDLPSPYTDLGAYPQNLAGDARNLYWFNDGVLDYVYSSHLLEDFSRDETASVLREWLRVIKPGGVLVLFGPDEQAYRAYSRERGLPFNPAHKIEDFGLNYVKKILDKDFAGRYSVVHEIELVDDYCFDLVVKKLK